ncbi:MAG: histidinol-phosphatase HisJ family protein [Anaerolineales bacterium]
MSVKPPDLHVHTHYSCDCHSTMLEMCRAALSAGVTEIGFTEHYDLIPEDPCFAYFDMGTWWQELERHRNEFAGELTIYAGIELGEPHRYLKEMKGVLDDYPWDYALGSLHWVGDELIFDRDYFTREPDAAYREYFLELGEMAEIATFDILAHMDVVKRFGFDLYGEFDPARYETEIRAVLHTIADRGLALEVNSSQLRRSVARSAPDRPVIDWFLDEGGRWVTLGSDAHEPAHIGHGLERGLTLVKSAGFEGVARFVQRVPEMSDA